MNQTNILQTIVKYEMTPLEAQAYRIACLYEYLVNKVFPNIRQYKASNGDPRKREVFKYAWKLLHDPDKPLDARDYKLYIFAQLKVFKAYMDAGQEVRLHPNCLTSNKAWSRWLLFKAKYEQRQKFQTVEQIGVQVNVPEKVKKELLDTKKYFQDRFGRLCNEDIVQSLERGSLQRWVAMRFVSGYYPYLSPVVTQWLAEKQQNLRSYFGNGLEVFKSGITTDSTAFFRSEFSHEYDTGQRTDQTDTSGCTDGAAAPSHNDQPASG